MQALPPGARPGRGATKERDELIQLSTEVGNGPRLPPGEGGNGLCAVSRGGGLVFERRERGIQRPDVRRAEGVPRDGKGLETDDHAPTLLPARRRSYTALATR